MSNPYEPPQSLDSSAAGDGNNGKAWASLGLGLASIVTCLIPLFGLPTTITGIVLGIKGLGPQRRGKAIAGIILSFIFLVVTILNAAWGAYMAATGQYPLLRFNQIEPAPKQTSPAPNVKQDRTSPPP
jgi:hypothetical protein